MNTRLIATLLALAALIGVVPTTTHASVNWSPVHGHSVNWQAIAPCNTCTNSVNWQGSLRAKLTHAIGRAHAVVIVTAAQAAQTAAAHSATTPFHLDGMTYTIKTSTQVPVGYGYWSVTGTFRRAYNDVNPPGSEASVYYDGTCTNNGIAHYSWTCQAGGYNNCKQTIVWYNSVYNDVPQCADFWANYTITYMYNGTQFSCYPRWQGNANGSISFWWGSSESRCQQNVA